MKHENCQHTINSLDSRIGELQAAIESWKREETMWREQEIELKQQLAEAVEVLEFYADPTNLYHLETVLRELPCEIMGEKARAFLLKVGAVK